MKFFYRALIIIGLSFTGFCSYAVKDIAAQINSQQPVIGIVVPLFEQSTTFNQSLPVIAEGSIEGFVYKISKIGNKQIVFVNSGLGKINAAITTSQLIEHFHPDLIFLSGSAGAVDIQKNKGRVVIGDPVVNIDFGTLTEHGIIFDYNQYLINPNSNRTLPLEFGLNQQVKQNFQRLNRKEIPPFMFGKIATSDALPNPLEQIKLLRQANFVAIEMEGAGFLQACWLLNTTCVVVRGISNQAGVGAITKQEIFYAAEKAARVVLKYIQEIRIQP